MYMVKVLIYNIGFDPDSKLKYEYCYNIFFTDKKYMRK